MNILKQNDLFSLLMKNLPTKPRIIEIGAFIGNHTIKFINYFPESEIYSFEPVPVIYKALCKRTKPYKNIRCYQVAISNEIGKELMFIAQNPKKSEKMSSANSLHKAKNRLKFSPIEYSKSCIVNKTTLDAWFFQNQISAPIDLLWIDAQGHEYHVFQGAHSVLKFVHWIHVEVHFGKPYEEQKEYQEVLAWLASHGFVEIARDFSETHSWFFGNVLLKKIETDI